MYTVSPYPRRACLHAKQISVSSTIPRHADPFWSVLLWLSAISSKFSNEVLDVKFDLQYFVTEMFRWMEIWHRKFTVHIQYNFKECRKSLVWLLRKSMSWKVSRSFIEWKLVLSGPLDIHWKMDVSSLDFCGDKCKYIDFRNITNLEIHLLFLVAGLLEDKAFRKGLVDVYISTNPLLSLKQDDFKITVRGERKGGKDCIKVSLVKKNRFLVWVISHYTRSANFMILNLYLLLCFPKKLFWAKKNSA